MKPDHSNKHESLYEFSYKKIEDPAARKPNLSEPRNLFSVKNANIDENYDEIDFIEDILSEDVKKKMLESGIKFRNKTFSTTTFQPENESAGIINNEAEDPHRQTYVSENTSGLPFSMLNEEAENNNSFISDKYNHSSTSISNTPQEFVPCKNRVQKSTKKQDNSNLQLNLSDISNSSYNSIPNPPNELIIRDNLSQNSSFNQSNASYTLKNQNEGEGSKKVTPVFVNNQVNMQNCEKSIEKRVLKEDETQSQVDIKPVVSVDEQHMGEKNLEPKQIILGENHESDEINKDGIQPNTIEKIMPTQAQPAYYHEIKGAETVLRTPSYEKLRSKNKVRCPIYKFNVIPDIPKQPQKILYEKIEEEFTEKSETFFDEAFIKKQTGIYEEVNKRINERKQEIHINSAPGEGPKKFYLENQPVVVFIDGCARMNDLRQSILYGILFIKEGGNVYKPHWFEFKNNHLTCLNQEENKITPLVVPNELNGDVIHPQNSELFLTKRFSINVYESRVYLVKNRVKYAGFLKCPFFTKEDFPELIDITEQRITKYYKIKSYYDLEISTTTGPICARVSYLEFALENSGNYIFFRVDNPDVFIRWLTAISFRQGRQWFEVR